MRRSAQGLSGAGRGERGIALVVVLWTVALVAIIAGQLIGRTTQDLRLARNLAERAAVELAADGAIRYAIASLAAGRDEEFAADGESSLAIGEAVVALAVEDEAGRIDLNAAPVALLEALLVALGMAPEEARRSADLIAAFRQSTPVVGVFAADRPPAFATTLDLARVPGLPETTRRLVRPYVTTFTGRSQPIPATQLEPVRRALAALEQDPTDSAGSQALWAAVAYGIASAGSEPRIPERTMRITASATGPSGARFARTAVVAIHPGRAETHTVLSWHRDWTTD